MDVVKVKKVGACRLESKVSTYSLPNCTQGSRSGAVVVFLDHVTPSIKYGAKLESIL